MSEEFFTTEDGVRRPSTDEEIEAVKKLRIERQNQELQKAEAKAKREAALEKLSALGLNADDLSALGL